MSLNPWKSGMLRKSQTWVGTEPNGGLGKLRATCRSGTLRRAKSLRRAQKNKQILDLKLVDQSNR